MKNGFHMRDILSIYRDAPPKARLHIFVRYLSCPVRQMERHVPRRGTILEIGCGHGLFTHILSLTSEERNIYGIDIAEEKISVAAPTGGEGVRFKKTDYFGMEVEGLDAVVLADVLYLLPRRDQERMLRKIYGDLSPGGCLVVKTTDRRPRWKYALAAVQEFISVKVVKITAGAGIDFAGAERLKEILEETGFEVRFVPLHRGYLHPHCLLVCAKK